MNTKLKSKWMDVTPRMAEKWLERNSVNRVVQVTHVDRLASDMEEGQYVTTHQGIAFDVDGILIDGQHRLTAIVQSGHTVKMLVTTGLPKRAQAMIDVDIRARTVANMFEIDGGAEKFGVPLAKLQQFSRAMYMGGRIRAKMTAQSHRAFALKYADEIAWAYHQFEGGTKNRSGKAAVVGAVARAYYGGRSRGWVTKISQFCSVLSSGLSDGSNNERAIIKLRDWIQNPRLSKHNGTTLQMETYRRTSIALWNFINDSTRSGRWDAFRIPEDQGFVADESDLGVVPAESAAALAEVAS